MLTYQKNFLEKLINSYNKKEIKDKSKNIQSRPLICGNMSNQPFVKKKNLNRINLKNLCNFICYTFFFFYLFVQNCI